MEFGKRQDPQKRLIGVVSVIVFHLLLVWGLVSGLGRKAIELLPAPMETKILEEKKVEEEPPPPPPPPKLDIPPPPFIPPPEINIQQSSAPTNSITTSNKPAPPAPPKPAAAGPSKPPVVQAKQCREPDYPAVSERLGETGTVLLQLLVGVDGKVSDSKVEKSSGFDRLDKAAVQALSRCKFTPGEKDGKPTPAWAPLKYTFRKQN